MRWPLLVMGSLIALMVAGVLCWIYLPDDLESRSREIEPGTDVTCVRKTLSPPYKKTIDSFHAGPGRGITEWYRSPKVQVRIEYDPDTDLQVKDVQIFQRPLGDRLSESFGHWIGR